MFENTIMRCNKAGRKAISLHLTTAEPIWIELAASAGFDCLHLDGEHGAFSPVAVDNIVSVAHAHGLSVKARVPNQNADEINRWLDRGIQGVMAPHVETGAQALALVNACYFGPLGHRSWGGGRGTEFNDETRLQGGYGGRRGFADFANDNMLVWAQVESKEGIQNLDSILAVEGLDGIAFGPYDLGYSIGIPGAGAEHPEVASALTEIEERTRAAGKRLSSDFCVETDLAASVLSAGRDFVAENQDSAFGP